MKTAFALVLILSSVLSQAALATTRTVTLALPGMTCPTCPITIKKSLEKITGVHAITSDVSRRTVTVTYDDARTQPTALTRATTDAGYPSTIQHQ